MVMRKLSRLGFNTLTMEKVVLLATYLRVQNCTCMIKMSIDLNLRDGFRICGENRGEGKQRKGIGMRGSIYRHDRSVRTTTDSVKLYILDIATLSLNLIRPGNPCVINVV
jgi:hypothetical protein